MLRFSRDHHDTSHIRRRWTATPQALRVQLLKFAAAAMVGMLMAACSEIPVFEASPASTPTEIGTPAEPERGSGVRGRVWIGPACPGPVVGTECPDVPYQAKIVITDLEGEEIARGQSDDEGYFQIQLPPGDYILEPQTPNPGGPPYTGPIPFTVEPGTYTELTVQYDSGIR